MPEPRLIAGIRCDEVLTHLSDYIDGVTAPDIGDAIEAHLSECGWCEEFGGRFARTVTLLRASLREPEEPAPDVTRRLMAALEEA